MEGGVWKEKKKKQRGVKGWWWRWIIHWQVEGDWWGKCKNKWNELARDNWWFYKDNAATPSLFLSCTLFHYFFSSADHFLSLFLFSISRSLNATHVLEMKFLNCSRRIWQGVRTSNDLGFWVLTCGTHMLSKWETHVYWKGGETALLGGKQTHQGPGGGEERRTKTKIERVRETTLVEWVCECVDVVWDWKKRGRKAGRTRRRERKRRREEARGRGCRWRERGGEWMKASKWMSGVNNKYR